MTEPRRPRDPGRDLDLDETLLDPGRVRRFPPRARRADAALADTLLDPGRRRAGDLPPQYKLIGPLGVPASQADLLLIRVRDSGEEVVLKRYPAARDLPDALVSYLSAQPAHVVRYLAIEPDYEVMARLTGGSLRDLRDTTPAGFDFATLHTIVQQVAAVLISLHRRHLVHGDIKPANLMLRARSPLDLAVIDFGIAGPPGDAPPDAQLNPAYQPPERIMLNQVGEAGDWWGLGMTLVELAAGEHPFEGLVAEDIRTHFVHARPVDTSGVPDEPRATGAGRRDRLRSLCQGLLALDPARRWGEREVSDWLAGRDPQPPTVDPRPAPTSPAGPERVSAERPYVFGGVSYHYRDELAVAMATTWNYTVEVLFERDPGGGQLDQLHGWLEQFPDDDGQQARRAVELVREDADQPPRVRLLRVIRALHPTRLPVYRNHLISRRNLPAVAHRALQNDGDAVSVLSDLWRYRLLPTFDAAAPVADAGGEALADLDRDWRAQHRRWYEQAALIDDPATQRRLAESPLESEVLAASLRAALRQPDDVAQAHRLVREHEAQLPLPVPWFSDLARRPELVWVALLLHGFALSQANSEADRRAAVDAEADALRARQLFREWSRRQNRSAALGWAVAGICLIASLWIALITASDAAGRVDDPAVGLAWVGAAVCAGVSLVVECGFAAEVGGRFHPRYSIPGAGMIALGPLGRWMQRAWLPAGATTLAMLAGITLVALAAPSVIPPVTTVAHVLWVVRRWRAWQAQVAAENAVIEQAERRAPPAGGPPSSGPPAGAPRASGPPDSGPSDTGGTPIAAMTGAHT